MKIVCTLILFAGLAYTQSVWAAGVVGNGSGTKPFDRGASLSNDGKKHDRKDGQDEWKKPEMPPASDIRKLDTTAFDAVSDRLKLTNEQSTRIADAKKEINDEITRLAHEQDDARKAYDAAKTEDACRAAGTKVMQTAAACRNYDPQVRWIAALRRILGPDGWDKYRELTKG
ncbi:MAG: hypothetical protein HY291_20740 [Planctomycetes bacterium]|nr:hypothetical protein [Planctomycetota bacterium]